MSELSSSDPHCCGAGVGVRVRGGLREWVVCMSFGSGGAGPERPFLLVRVLGVARAVWWFFGDGVPVIRSCGLLLVWGLAPSRFLLLLGLVGQEGFLYAGLFQVCSRDASLTSMCILRCRAFLSGRSCLGGA